MQVTERGLEITIEDDPVLLAGALNAGAALDKEHVETRFLNPAESDWGKLRFWAQKLEEGFGILDGQIRTSNFAEDTDVEKVYVDVSAEELLGALAAYGTALLPPSEGTDRPSAVQSQDRMVEDSEVIEQSGRINSAIAKVLQLQRSRDAA